MPRVNEELAAAEQKLLGGFESVKALFVHVEGASLAQLKALRVHLQDWLAKINTEIGKKV